MPISGCGRWEGNYDYYYAPDIINVGRVIVVIIPFHRPQPEIGIVAHAQFQVRFVERAVFFQKDFTGRGVTQEVVVKFSHNGGEMLFDDGFRAHDGLFVGRGKADKVCHIPKVFSCIRRAAFDRSSLIRFLYGGFHYLRKDSTLRGQSCECMWWNDERLIVTSL